MQSLLLDYGLVRCALTPEYTIKDKFTIGVKAHCEDKPCKDFSLAQTYSQADTWNESRTEKCMWDTSAKK